MQVQVDIGFEQLIKIVRALPKEKLEQLSAEIARKTDEKKELSSLEALLLSGPVATPKQIHIIEKNREAVNRWRTK